MPPDNTTKNITTWQPQTVKGSLVQIGTAFIVDQSGNFIIDQSKNFIVTTPNIVVPPNVTVWSEAPAS